jgi:hypothetical protein
LPINVEKPMSFSCNHFRTEFVRQSEANVLRKLTMTQFMGILIACGIGLMILKASIWTAPVWIALGYVLAYNHNGEFVFMRLVAYAGVWLRLAAARPRIINVQEQWNTARLEAQAQMFSTTIPAAVTIEDTEGAISY